MVVGLLSPQLSRFFHTGTVFDSPALPNNCHKHLIIRYSFFFFCINILSVPDVNASLGYLCRRLTASPKLISSVFFTLVNQLTSFPYSFFHCVSLRLDLCQLYNYNTSCVTEIWLHSAQQTAPIITCSHGVIACSSRFTMDVQQLFTVLKKEAECPLCLETVNNPKTLPCIHSFCLECLDKHANFARRQLQATIKCPVCQTSFQIPEGDSFKNLPASYHLNRLVDVLALKDSGAQAQKCSSCEENNTASSYCFLALQRTSLVSELQWTSRGLR